jgi:hypothetical protein
MTFTSATLTAVGGDYVTSLSFPGQAMPCMPTQNGGASGFSLSAGGGLHDAAVAERLMQRLDKGTP